MEKQLTAINSFTLRNLIDKVNELGIQKEDIVNIIKENETFLLLYYKNN